MVFSGVRIGLDQAEAVASTFASGVFPGVLHQTVQPLLTCLSEPAIQRAGYSEICRASAKKLKSRASNVEKFFAGTRASILSPTGTLRA